MDPPPFNFNTATSTTGKPQPAPSAFGAAVPKVAFGAGALFNKPSIFSQAASKKETDTITPVDSKPAVSLAPSSSLSSRLTIPAKNKDSIFKGHGDSTDDKVTNLPEGQFAIPNRMKDGGRLFGNFKKQTLTPDESVNKAAPKNPFQSKPTQKATKIGFQFGGMNNENRSLFGKPKSIVEEESHDETDHAAKKETPSTLFGVPLASTSTKGFGGFAKEKNVSSFKPFADRTWKPTRRASPAPETRTTPSKMGSEEEKLVQKLVALKGQKCPDDYDKYILLDERDKILCQLREVNSPLIQRLERCEEMCTEKERYQRIVQKGVSPFECDEETGDVSHEMMVKQYARSAADQERPLPHELRSEKIMNHAMCYLLHNVLDQFPETPDQRAAWYNFLWNRTRALRKEVTQLSLSDSLALNLVERCTRLHVLFGYVLCDLETEHFDAAMNNETLGKCLQTLRHFYEDFEKRGIPCVNEAEFRSYDVMLHMNDTNILSQVLSYRTEVRQSQSVRLALQLASAFRDKNYCRFFRLLQTDASYLQCCVAHKLFNSARSTAISIMANAYGRSTFPLEKLQRILGFDDLKDLTTVLNVYGLRTEGTEFVMLYKDDLTLNEVIPLTTYQWIDRKSIGKLSSVVYGPDLFQFIASRCDASNSFNYHHEFTNDKVLETLLSGSDIPQTSSAASSSFAQSAGSLSMQATMEQRKRAEAEKLRRGREAERAAERLKLAEKITTKVVDEVINGIVNEEIMKAKIARKQRKELEAERKRKEEEERLRLKHEEKRKEKEKEVAKNLSVKIAKEVSEKQMKKIIDEEIRRERRDREQKLAQRVVEKFWKEILKSVDREVKSICEEMVNEKEVIHEGLRTFRNRMTRRWLLQFWNRWRDWVQFRKQLRRCVPRWEAEDVANNLYMKYGSNSQKTSPVCGILDRPSNSIRLTIFKKNRDIRIARRAFAKWRTAAAKIRVTREMAEERHRRENEFYQRFEKSAKIETRFKFDAPDDWMKEKRRSSDFILQERVPLENLNRSFQFADSSLYVARRHLEDWEPSTGLPDDVKEKLKRKRESFEKVCEDHLLKKKREEEFLCGAAKTENLHIKKVTGEADALLDETLRYTAELDQMMADIRSRRIDDL